MNPSDWVEINLPCIKCLRLGLAGRPRSCPCSSVVSRDEYRRIKRRAYYQLMEENQRLERELISEGIPLHGLNFLNTIDTSEPNQYETPTLPYYMEANQGMAAIEHYGNEHQSPVPEMTPEQYYGGTNTNPIETDGDRAFSASAMAGTYFPNGKYNYVDVKLSISINYHGEPNRAANVPPVEIIEISDDDDDEKSPQNP